MPNYEKKTIITSYKLGIKKKFKSVAENVESVTAILHTCKSVFQNRVKDLLQIDDDSFHSLYQKLCTEFEFFQQQLCLLEASIEQFTEFHLSSKYSKDEESKEESHTPLDTSQPNVSQSSLNLGASSQTNCKTLFTRQPSSTLTYSSLENVFSPLQSDKIYEEHGQSGHAYSENGSQPNLQLNDSTSSTNFSQLLYDQSQMFASQSTFYQSISSNISALKSSSATSSQSGYKHLEVEKFENYLSSKENNSSQLTSANNILQPAIVIPSSISATLTHVINPSDFWMQIEKENTDIYSFPISQFIDTDPPPPHMQIGDFCLAPFKPISFYYRAKILTEVSDDEEVEVFFIDHGSNQNVAISYLRILPESLYQIPMQAIHCYLCDISPRNEIWSKSAVQKLQEYQNNSFETRVKSFDGSKYAVQLVASMPSLEDGDDYSLDIAESLWLDDLANMKEPSNTIQASGSTEISNQISCDSGVSVTSNRQASPYKKELHISSDLLHSSSSGEPINTLQAGIFSRCAQLVTNKETKSTIEDLISFESTEEMCIMDTPPIECKTSNKCSRALACDCPLHLIVLPPSLTFVEKDMVLVMMSHVDTPSEFYVNAAIANSFTLDELREQMTVHYESLSQNNLVLEDLKEGMFLAGYYDKDRSWYRVQVLRVNSEVFNLLNFFPKSKSSCDVYVQYIDYGNKASISCSNLHPLLPEFAEFPCFSIKCSLAGIVPKSQSFPWNENAVKKFKELASFERCLTAQIQEDCSGNHCQILSLGSEPLPVLLWDTEGSKDVLINQALVESGVAEFDSKISQTNNKFKKEDIEVLNQWNPMQEEFVSVQNSYGVATDDIEVAVAGYKRNDDNYICKYYSLRDGKCPNGADCRYQHVSLAEYGVTRDTEEVYSLDNTPPLPDSASHVLIQVSAVISPTQFYAVLPFGDKDVNEIDSIVNRGSSCSWVKDEISLLYADMNQKYSNLPFEENTTIALSYGSIVAAWHEKQKSWHRGRIIDILGVTEPFKVFFVDFGDEEWIHRKMIRTIRPEYLHHPFQAVGCHLSDVEPLGFEMGKTWSNDAICRFQEIVSCEVLLAHITYRCGKALHLTLRKTNETDHRSIGDILVSEGFAQHVALRTTNNNESSYVPG